MPILDTHHARVMFTDGPTANSIVCAFKVEPLTTFSDGKQKRLELYIIDMLEFAALRQRLQPWGEPIQSTPLKCLSSGRRSVIATCNIQIQTRSCSSSRERPATETPRQAAIGTSIRLEVRGICRKRSSKRNSACGAPLCRKASDFLP